ncbi:hypothetical protein [Pseudonocardia humida]|uniref:Uncharacterized protein n=1 Tax=Pseudonocardia humida TaxID=2800819 RepID=A0ABT1A853_9PSEU|nr:hypothetical protein [Pseudonocardia humida]MCO1659205.1 hypothetical protein [Pseudonocardia humida]
MAATESERPVGRVRRPHRWACRHCDMVTDYRLTRDAELRQAKGAFAHDEDYQLTTFKQWLQSFQWEQPRDIDTDTAADGTGERHRDPLDRARAAVVAAARSRSQLADATAPAESDQVDGRGCAAGWAR